MSDSFNTTVTNWQGMDDEPTAGSENLVKSGGVAKDISDINEKLVGHIVKYSGPTVVNSGVDTNYNDSTQRSNVSITQGKSVTFILHRSPNMENVPVRIWLSKTQNGESVQNWDGISDITGNQVNYTNNLGFDIKSIAFRVLATDSPSSVGELSIDTNYNDGYEQEINSLKDRVDNISSELSSTKAITDAVVNQRLIDYTGYSDEYEIQQGVAINTTPPASRYYINIPAETKIKIKVNYPNGGKIDSLYFYNSDSSIVRRFDYKKNNEFVDYQFDIDFASIGFTITSQEAVADGVAQITLVKIGRVSEIENEVENLTEEVEELTNPNRIRLADVLSHWLKGEKFPIGFHGDSTTDGTSTTGWKTVPDNNIDEPCSHPGTEAVWWLTQTNEGQTYYAEQVALGKTVHEICNEAHLLGKGRGKVLYNWTFAYPYLLRKLLREELGNNTLEVYNIGYYGASLANNYSQLDAIYGDVYSDVKMVGITLGINDRGSFTPSTYYEGILNLLTTWVNYFLNKNITPFMVTNQVVTQCGGDVGSYNAMNQDYIQTLCNKAKQEIAKKFSLEIIDLNDFGRLVLECSNYVNSEITENLHFKDVGHKLEAQFLFSKLIPWTNRTEEAKKIYFGLNCATCKTELSLGNSTSPTIDKFKVQVNYTKNDNSDSLVFDAYMFNNSRNGAYTVKYLTPVASGYIVIDGDTDNPITIDSTEMTLDPWDIGLHHVQVYTGESTTVAFKGFLLEQN